MELKQEELDKVLAGNSEGMSEESALNNPNLFRDKQIEELKKEERKNYYKEFKKTPIGKQTNFKLNLSCVSAIICLIIVGFMAFYNYQNTTYIYLIAIIAIFEAISIIVLSMYNNISFSSWLKIKYDIKRW